VGNCHNFHQKCSRNIFIVSGNHKIFLQMKISQSTTGISLLLQHRVYYVVLLFAAGKVSYKIEKDQLVVSELFAILNSVKVQLGIADWGVKRTTLEDGENVCEIL